MGVAGVDVERPVGRALRDDAEKKGGRGRDRGEVSLVAVDAAVRVVQALGAGAAR